MPPIRKRCTELQIHENDAVFLIDLDVPGLLPAHQNVEERVLKPDAAHTNVQRHTVEQIVENPARQLVEGIGRD